ncbi:hypothetical protein BDZ89DRAFT_601088 [Hymenopellis radicata]|nr:hypothetical protein BDZ89DRAFT_601088 [Hymenopellis radicata]
MDDEEVDWEVDEEQHIRRASMHNNDDDADDAVSLGPDDDEPEYYGLDAPKDALPESDPPTSSRESAGHSVRAPTPSSFSAGPAREDSSGSFKNGATMSPQRSKGPGHGIPGLPPKPSAAVAFNSARPRPSHPSLIAATAMSRSSKPKSVSANSSADEPPLPPDWQARQAQSQQGPRHT